MEENLELIVTLEFDPKLVTYKAWDHHVPKLGFEVVVRRIKTL